MRSLLLLVLLAIPASLAGLVGCSTIGEDEIEVGAPFVANGGADAFDGLDRTTPVVAGTLAAAPWREWRGPDRDGRLPGFAAVRLESGGWRERWRVRVGVGISGVIADGERVFTHAREGDAEIVVALDARSGERLWSLSHPIEDWAQPFQTFGVSDGPLATPTLTDGRLYTVGIHGRAQAIDAASGDLLFAVEPLELDGERSELMYGHASSPLVRDGRLFIALGSTPREDADDPASSPARGHLLALDARTGELLWRAIEDPVTYTSPVLARIHGREQLVVRSWKELLGLDPASGEILWRHEAVAGGLQRDCATPLVVDDVVWITNPFHGTIAVQVRPRDTGFDAVRLFRTGALASITASPIHRGRHLYGLHRKGRLVCIDAYSGERRWSARALDEHASFLSFENGTALALGDEGDLLAIELSPDGLREIAAWKVGDETWAQPGVDARSLYIRDGEDLVALAWPASP